MKIILIDLMLSTVYEDDKLLYKCLDLFKKDEKYRTDNNLINEVIKYRLGSGRFTSVFVVNIPDGIKYRIDRHGSEEIITII